MKIEFDTDNDAFADGNADYEIIRILDSIKLKVSQGYNEGVIIDINGNKIGNWIF